MKTWSYGTNSLPQWRRGSLFLTEAPWYVLFIDWLADHAHTFIPPIPFPNFPRKIWFFSDGEETTPQEWYGDLQMWWCGKVCSFLFEWSWAHPKRKEYTFEVGYDKIKEVLYEYDKKHFDRDIE